MPTSRPTYVRYRLLHPIAGRAVWCQGSGWFHYGPVPENYVTTAETEVPPPTQGSAIAGSAAVQRYQLLYLGSGGRGRPPYTHLAAPSCRSSCSGSSFHSAS